MRKFTHIAVSLLFTALTFNSFSQENFLPGYIIKNNGDTVRGLINYRNWEFNPKHISFKMSEKSFEQEFRPFQIMSFGVAGEIYNSAAVKAEITDIRPSELEYNTEMNIISDTVFLQTLIEGDKSLYYYKRMMSHDNFYVKTDTAYELLQYKKYLKSMHGKESIIENRKYAGQLLLTLTGCDKLKPSIGRVKYSKNELTKLFLKYYECENIKPEFVRIHEGIKVVPSVFAGFSHTSLVMASYAVDPLKFTTSANPMAGVSIDIVMPRNLSRWSLNNEIAFSSFKGNASFVDEDRDTIYMELGNGQIEINNMARFAVPIRKVEIVLNAGISNAFSLIRTNYMKETPHGPFFNDVREGLVFKDARNHEQSIIAGIGFRMNHFSLELRKRWGNGMSPYELISTKTNRTIVLVSYRF